MAPALRVISPAPNVVVAAAGPFGCSLGRSLTDAIPASSLVAAQEVLAMDLARTDVVIACCWKPSVTYLRAVDDLCAESGCMLLPVVPEETTVRIGPVCGRGPLCYWCYIRRVWQHDPDAPVLEALHTAYSRDAELGVGGFFPHQVDTAAALVVNLLADGLHSSLGRSVLYLDACNHSLEKIGVVPVHDCQRCYAKCS